MIRDPESITAQEYQQLNKKPITKFLKPEQIENPWETTKTVGGSTIGTMATVYGAPHLKTLSGALTLGLTGALGGTISAATGEDVEEGIGRGIGKTPATLGVVRATDPLIYQGLTKVGLTGPGKGFLGNLVQRLVSGGSNVGQGLIVDAATGYPTTPSSVFTDFALGTALGSQQFRPINVEQKHVVQLVNDKTGEQLYKTIPAGELKTYSKLDNALPASAYKRGDWTWHVTAKGPKDIEARGFKYAGTSKGIDADLPGTDIDVRRAARELTDAERQGGFINIGELIGKGNKVNKSAFEEATGLSGKKLNSAWTDFQSFAKKSGLDDSEAFESWMKQSDIEVGKVVKTDTEAPEFEIGDQGQLEAFPETRVEVNAKTLEPPEVRGGVKPPQLDFTEWNDKQAFKFTRETFERNIEDIAPEGQAQQVKDFAVFPIRENEFNRVKFTNAIRKTLRDKVVDDLGIRAGSEDDALIQIFGEKRISLDELKNQTDNWEGVVEASRLYRNTYDEILDSWNAVRRQFGYDPIPKRADYFRHFQELDFWHRNYGLLSDNEVGKLPTEISGITGYFKPGKPFSVSEIRRKGDLTEFSAIMGMDRYLNSVSKQMYHTDSIQRVRALEKYIREAAKADPESVRLSNFVANLNEYGNLIAGKKSRFDRGFEELFGREIYGIINNSRARTSANMIGGNISPPMTNFIPFTQTLATTSKKNMAVGLWEATTSPFQKNFAEIDGVESSFLVRRFPEWSTDLPVGKQAIESLNWLFKIVDRFSTKAAVTARYLDNIDEGLSPKQAMREADDYAGRVFADRSIGQLPNFFSVRSVGPITQFQTEVNNVFSFITKDIKRDSSGVLDYISKMGQFILYSYLFNNLYERVTGRRPTIDPIHAGLAVAGMTEESAGENLPTRIYQGATEIGENLPFVGGLTGGRFPVTAGLPDVPGLLTGKAQPLDELVKPLLFFGAPAGGLQLKKTLQGIGANTRSGRFNRQGQLMAPVDDSTPNKLLNMVYGPYRERSSQLYYNKELSPLTDRETALWRAAVEQGRDPVQTWASIYRRKIIEGLPRKVTQILNDPKLTADEKVKKINEVRQEAATLITKFNQLQNREVVRTDDIE